MPVSYTHLDVYKRQIQGPACDFSLFYAWGVNAFLPSSSFRRRKPAKRASSKSAPLLPKRAWLIKAVRFRTCGFCSSTPYRVGLTAACDSPA